MFYRRLKTTLLNLYKTPYGSDMFVRQMLRHSRKWKTNTPYNSIRCRCAKPVIFQKGPTRVWDPYVLQHVPRSKCPCMSRKVSRDTYRVSDRERTSKSCKQKVFPLVLGFVDGTICKRRLLKVFVRLFSDKQDSLEAPSSLFTWETFTPRRYFGVLSIRHS